MSDETNGSRPAGGAPSAKGATRLDSLSTSLQDAYAGAAKEPLPADWVGLLAQLDKMYRDTVAEPVPDRLADQLRSFG